MYIVTVGLSGGKKEKRMIEWIILRYMASVYEDY
jgi:hypothetical protein